MLKNQHKAVHVFIHQDRHFYFARIWDLALFIKSVAELPFSVNLFVNYRKKTILIFGPLLPKCEARMIPSCFRPQQNT